jgi:uncharacterized membrane protein
MGLSPLGIVHTLISLVAVASGIVALVRYKRIDPATTVAKLYIVTTLLTALTAFGLHRHGFGPGHVLAILTLVVIGIAMLAQRTTLFGASWRGVQTFCYSITLLFHAIPAVTGIAVTLQLRYFHKRWPRDDHHTSSAPPAIQAGRAR